MMLIYKQKNVFCCFYSTMMVKCMSNDIREVCSIVSDGVGSLDDLEVDLDKVKLTFSSSVLGRVLDSCKTEAPTRRLLRFFFWSRKKLDNDLNDADFNHAIRVFADKKDFIAVEMLISDLGKEGRTMEIPTFSLVAEILVKLGREDEALGIFKNSETLKCPKNSTIVAAIVSALCNKGHAKRAEGVVYHHRDKILGVESCIYKSLLYGWCVKHNVKEARRIIKEMKSLNITPDLFCYNTFVNCLCQKNLRSNPSGLLPEALNVFMEMRTHRIEPNTVTYNILLSCLGKTRRVKESIQILDSMKKCGCSPDWVTYYLVAKVLYLTGRFGKAKQIVDQMVEEGIVPGFRFYHDLIGILCGVERVNYALELFDLMKKSRKCLGSDYFGSVYDLLIEKLCRGGEFEKGKQLWDEASETSVALECSRSVLDPSITKVFKPMKKVEEEVCVAECDKPKFLRDWKKKGKQKFKKIKKNNKKHKNV